MGIFDSFSINSSGLTAQRFRMDVIAENVANANTTRTADGTHYKRKVVTFQERSNPVASFNSVLMNTQSKYNRFVGSGVKVGGDGEQKDKSDKDKTQQNTPKRRWNRFNL
jgi:flagellar basal-body rod protein FlgC